MDLKQPHGRCVGPAGGAASSGDTADVEVEGVWMRAAGLLMSLDLSATACAETSQTAAETRDAAVRSTSRDGRARGGRRSWGSTPQQEECDTLGDV